MKISKRKLIEIINEEISKIHNELEIQKENSEVVENQYDWDFVATPEDKAKVDKYLKSIGTLKGSTTDKLAEDIVTEIFSVFSRAVKEQL